MELDFVNRREERLGLDLDREGFALDFTLQLDPQLMKPRVELTLVAEIMLVVSQADLMEESCPKIKQALCQLLGHCIELLVA